MKKTLLVIGLVFVAVGLFWLKRPASPSTLSLEDTKTPVPLVSSPEVKQLEINLGEETFSVLYTGLFGGEEIELKANFADKTGSKALAEAQSCRVLVNGGFYTTENKPIGLFTSNYEQLSSFKQNSLFDGILSINDLETPRITRVIPQDRLRLALQSGPMLVENSFVQKLSIRNDSGERRVVAAITGDNKMFFAIIYKKDSLFSGPKLADLPRVLELFEKEAEIEIADAINLDGGTASALYSTEISVREASPIGSYFCVSPQILL